MRFAVHCLAALAALCAAPAALAATPFSKEHKLFSFAEKNGRIPPATELLIFNHTCGSTALPCAITQMHFPSIYPGAGCPWDWESGVLRVYVDGAPAPTVNLTLLQLASVGAAGAQGNGHKDISPFSGGHLFGKNAQTGGVWSTVRIPFAASVRVTLTQAASCASPSTYWAIVRGIEGLALQLGEIELPPAARLVQSTIAATTYAPDTFIPLASAPAGVDGMVLYTFLDATSGDDNYLEGCVHLTSSLSSSPNSTIFLSSGTEDYFLSASYFDEGTFADSQAGYVFQGPGGTKSMYKLHDSRDMLPFHDGMELVWRNNENGQSCPNHFSPSAQAPLRTGPLTLSSVVFSYQWPSEQ